MTTEVEVQLACRLLFVDLEGLNDGRAVKTIVPQVNPRKMVRCNNLAMLYHLLIVGRRLSYMHQLKPVIHYWKVAPISAP